jgi:very-short-patch-repair endonuclease
VSHRVDWYLEDLNLVLELHGKQHYQVENFGGEEWERAHWRFVQGASRDTEKQVALEQAGYLYRVMGPTKASSLTSQLLREVLLG